MMDYKEEIERYGRGLPEEEKGIAINAFTELYKSGFSFQWIYYAILQLKGRSVKDYKNLLFYSEFQEEVTAAVTEAEERNARYTAAIEKQKKQASESRSIAFRIIPEEESRAEKAKRELIEGLKQLEELEEEESETCQIKKYNGISKGEVSVLRSLGRSERDIERIIKKIM